MRFSCEPNMTSWCYNRQGALYTVFDDELVNVDCGFLLELHIHSLQDNELFLQTKNNVIVLSPLEGAV